jgi:hypothetical protein
MRVHFDVLGWLYVLVGAMAIVTGASVGVLVVGMLAVAGNQPETSAVGPIVRLFLASGALMIAAGGVMVAIGRALGARRRGGRRAALLAAVANLAILPFGTALGIYTYWVLVNDEARRAFGRPTRAPDIQSGS